MAFGVTTNANQNAKIIVAQKYNQVNYQIGGKTP